MNQKEMQEQIANLSEGVFAVISTTKGALLAELYYDKTPITVANFVGLAEGNLAYKGVQISKPFYEGIIFHRVIPQFMIQTGDPRGMGTGGPGYSFPDEIVAELQHSQKGILSMANSGPNSNGSQFFITQVPTPHLDGKHTVFGKVIAGLEVIDAIAGARRGPNDKPIEPISIEHIDILRNGPAAEAFTGETLFSDNVKALDAAFAQQAEARKQQFAQIMQEKYPQATATGSGLFYVEKQQPSSPITPVTVGRTVVLHYTGSFLGATGAVGQKFDSSYDRNQPITIVAGRQSVIPGFEEGLSLAKKGQKLQLFLPYFLAYGESGIGPIPPFSNLVFEIEVVDVQ